MERQTTVISQEELNRQSAICHEIASYWNAQGRTPLAFVDTYGCQQNEADSERIRGMLRECGYRMSDTEEGADCIVINTCAIREHAETRVYGNVGALVHTKNRPPAQKIFLCGCMMGQPAVVDKIKHSYHHVDGVFNPHQLWRFPELLQSVLTKRKRIFAVDDSAGNIAEGIQAGNLQLQVDQLPHHGRGQQGAVGTPEDSLPHFMELNALKSVLLSHAAEILPAVLPPALCRKGKFHPSALSS